MTGLARPSRIRIFRPVLLLALCLAARATVVPAQTRPFSAASDAAPPEPKHLSARSRKEVFEAVWRDIHDHYYDPAFNGVNWDEIHTKYLPLVAAAKDDADFYAVMSAMTSELHDAHTRFSSPAQWRHYKKQQGVNSGFNLDDVEGKAVVVSVRPDSSAAYAGIEPGMIVRSVDGKPIEQRIAEIENSRPASSSVRATRMFAYSRVISGPPDTTLKVGLQRSDGTTFEATVTRQLYSVAPEVSTDVRPSGAAYIRFDEFQPSITKQFRQALERFRNSGGIIIDLRRNGGGDLSVLLAIAGYFFDKKTLFAKDSTRSGKPLSEFAGILHLSLELYVGRAGDQIYSGPVVILVGTRSASSSEVFAAGMQETQRAKIVGGPTCGCVLGVAKPRGMKGGGVLEISEVLWFSPKGRKLEGVGIVPDEAVVPTVADLQHKRDPVMAEAERVLRQMASAERHGPRS
jgi:carboxyl-terminal processing protease